MNQGAKNEEFKDQYTSYRYKDKKLHKIRCCDLCPHLHPRSAFKQALGSEFTYVVKVKKRRIYKLFGSLFYKLHLLSSIPWY